MKKIIAILVAIILCLSVTALGDRALVDPQEQYEILLEETDGSEEMIFYLVDIANDEEELVKSDGSVLIRQHMLKNDGKTAIELVQFDTRLYICEYGRVAQFTVHMDGEKYEDVYCTESFMYREEASGVVSAAPAEISADEFNGTWENWVFPYYVPLEAMIGTTQGEDGCVYFLVRSDEGETLLEYVVSSEGMVMQGVNQYARDEEDGKYYLLMYTEVIRGEGDALPQAVLYAMKQNEKVTPSDNAA
ncbi:MAG: hypothetical protein K5663_08365 [Clostridiales bacterium]|nr:hypothetical protein [Clostridiales bacterium]